MEQSEKKIQENGSNTLEQETNWKDQNGDAVIDKEVKARKNQLKKTEEKAVEEKAKKRMSELSPSLLRVKRTKSSNGLCR